jgi:hypothetical protein
MNIAMENGKCEPWVENYLRYSHCQVRLQGQLLQANDDPLGCQIYNMLAAQACNVNCLALKFEGFHQSAQPIIRSTWHKDLFVGCITSLMFAGVETCTVCFCPWNLPVAFHETVINVFALNLHEHCSKHQAVDCCGGNAIQLYRWKHIVHYGNPEPL